MVKQQLNNMDKEQSVKVFSDGKIICTSWVYKGLIKHGCYACVYADLKRKLMKWLEAPKMNKKAVQR